MSFGGDALPYENEQDKLWVPQTAQAVDDKSMYDAIFNSTVRRNTIYFTTQPLGGNVLTSSVLKEVRRFDAMVTANLNASEGTDGALEGGTVRYEDVCAQSLQRFGGADSAAPSCLIFGHPLELFYRVGGEFVLDWTDAEILAVVNSGKGIDERLYPADSNRTFNVEATFGGLEYDEAGTITGAKAILLTYSLAQFPEGDARRDAALAWEDQLNLLIGDQWTDEGLSVGSASAAQVVWSSPTVNIYPQTEGAISRELGSNIRGDIILINIGFMLIGGYALLVFFKFHPTRSRALLAISGIVSCVFSVGVAYGFSTLLGFEVNPVITVLPFILLGIGVDDMFVLVNELDATDPKKPPAERIALAMGHAGVAITITSVTDLFAFALGTTSQLPALATFCVFAAIGITADFLVSPLPTRRPPAACAGRPSPIRPPLYLRAALPPVVACPRTARRPPHAPLFLLRSCKSPSSPAGWRSMPTAKPRPSPTAAHAACRRCRTTSPPHASAVPRTRAAWWRDPRRDGCAARSATGTRPPSPRSRSRLPSSWWRSHGPGSRAGARATCSKTFSSGGSSTTTPSSKRSSTCRTTTTGRTARRSTSSLPALPRLTTRPSTPR